MVVFGKFISNTWNGIKEKFGTAGKLIKSGANKTLNFIKDNQDAIGKIAGTALGAGLNIYTNGAAAPWINGANNYIQSLPDNTFTKQLKNISKGAMFDYNSNNTQYNNNSNNNSNNTQNNNNSNNTQYTDTKKEFVEKNPSQTNALTEYQSPRMSNYIPVPVNKMLTLFNKHNRNRPRVNKKSRKRQTKKKT